MTSEHWSKGCTCPCHTRLTSGTCYECCNYREEGLVEIEWAIEKIARYLMKAFCPFEGVSGDFDNCSSLTRQKYEEDAAAIFGLTLEDYYNLRGDEDD